MARSEAYMEAWRGLRQADPEGAARTAAMLAEAGEWNASARKKLSKMQTSETRARFEELIAKLPAPKPTPRIIVRQSPRADDP